MVFNGTKGEEKMGWTILGLPIIIIFEGVMKMGCFKCVLDPCLISDGKSWAWLCDWFALSDWKKQQQQQEKKQHTGYCSLFQSGYLFAESDSDSDYFGWWMMKGCKGDN